MIKSGPITHEDVDLPQGGETTSIHLHLLEARNTLFFEFGLDY